MVFTVFGTVISGVLIFVFSQMLLKWIIEPVHQLKKTIADVLNTYVRYAYAIHNPEVIPPVLHDEVFGKLRQLAGQLHADVALIPEWVLKYPRFRKIFSIPERRMIHKGAQNLIAVGNWMNLKDEKNFKQIVRNIQYACDNLGLYIDPKDRVPDEYLNA